MCSQLLMQSAGNDLLKPLLAVFVVDVIAATVRTAASIIVVARTKFALLRTVAIAAAFALLLRAEGFYIRRVGKLQLALCNVGQLALDGIIVHHILMPVAVGQLHVIGNRIGKTLALFFVWLVQGFVD